MSVAKRWSMLTISLTATLAALPFFPLVANRSASAGTPSPL
ncbi:MAG: hypothetical protein WAN02_15625 [Mycobacterium sp.]